MKCFVIVFHIYQTKVLKTIIINLVYHKCSIVIYNKYAVLEEINRKHINSIETDNSCVLF